MGLAAALALAAWRIVTLGGATLDRIEARSAPTIASSPGSAQPARPLSSWKLGKRSWGSDADGDERDRLAVAPDFSGLDVAEAGR
jgi:hypothetical protein